MRDTLPQLQVMLSSPSPFPLQLGERIVYIHSSHLPPEKRVLYPPPSTGGGRGRVNIISDRFFLVSRLQSGIEINYGSDRRPEAVSKLILCSRFIFSGTIQLGKESSEVYDE